jgi:eukaryotic-like serine/threonine-protein kinase
MSSDSPLMLEDVTADLGRVLGVVDDLRQQQGTASYEEVQVQTANALRLHLLSYVRFLEGDSLLSYDRISDQMELTEQGVLARSNPDSLREAARQAFADQIADDEKGGGDAFGNMFDDMAQEMDAAFGGGVPQAEESAGMSASSAVIAEAIESEARELADHEENTMNGEINTSGGDSQWAASDQGGSMNQQAYERIEELGSGGIGTVFRGRQVRLDREVAIKEIREIFNVFAGVQRDDIIDRFQSIIETQASLIHPNIVQVIDVDTTGEYPFSVMQLAPGGNLRRLIEHGDRPPLKVSIKYFLQILHALNTAHDQGVVHGSLKPENVVLDHAGNAMVSDFGVSRIVERDGGRGNQVYVGVGTVAYMSPEQFQDPNLATVKSDIYSLGIMFYEMLTGKVPGRRSPMPSSFYPDIPRALDDVFDRMSMDREEDRYDTVEEIIADIYGSEDVLDILDKRSGVLFLRDPMAHGELGLGEGVAAEIAAGAATPVEDEGSAAQEDSEVDEPEEFEAEDSAAEETAHEDSEAEEQDAEDLEDDGEEVEVEDEEADEDDGDVLNKLDKYGEMFDDE